MEKETRKMRGYGKRNIQEENGYERGMGWCKRIGDLSYTL
jgi:hypothetical protein